MKALKAETYTDPLSGLLNRRGFEERRKALLLRQCASARLPVALVLADLDHFKALNDQHGHEAGDRVIADFAAKLRFATGTRGACRAHRRRGVRRAPAAVRSCHGAPVRRGDAVALFVRSGVTSLPPGAVVTASFGIAVRTGEEGLAPLMQRADEALYKAKKNGRDSVRLSYRAGGNHLRSGGISRYADAADSSEQSRMLTSFSPVYGLCRCLDMRSHGRSRIYPGNQSVCRRAAVGRVHDDCHL